MGASILWDIRLPFFCRHLLCIQSRSLSYYLLPQRASIMLGWSMQRLPSRRGQKIYHLSNLPTSTLEVFSALLVVPMLSTVRGSHGCSSNDVKGWGPVNVEIPIQESNIPNSPFLEAVLGSSNTTGILGCMGIVLSEISPCWWLTSPHFQYVLLTAIPQQPWKTRCGTNRMLCWPTWNLRRSRL